MEIPIEGENIYIKFSQTLNQLKRSKNIYLISMIHGLSGTYEDKLQLLGLQTLEERRKRTDIVVTFKIIKGVDRVDFNSWFSSKHL